MPMVLHKPSLPYFDAALLKRCQTVPSSATSDAFNRASAMGGAIKPVRSGLRLCGRAGTVASMRGGNSATHAAIGLLESGDVLVMFRPGLFKGKRIPVTGGGTGLGREMADKYLELGADMARGRQEKKS